MHRNGTSPHPCAPPSGRLHRGPASRATARDRPYYTTGQPALPVESSGAVQATPRSTLKLVCMGDASVPTLPPSHTRPYGYEGASQATS